MLKSLTIALLAFSLSACTAYIREDKFIAQDENVVNYATEELASLIEKFPEFQVKPLALSVGEQGAQLRGILLDKPDTKHMIVFIPGNGMSVSKDGVKAFERLKDMNRDIVFFDRRGMGASEGRATVASLGEDAVTKLKFLINKYQPTSIVVHGFSLGSFVAGYVAKEAEISGLVLEGAATNVDDWIDKSTPWYAKPFLTIEVDEPFYSIDNKEVVSTHYSGPLLVIGGEDDEQVPVALSHALYEASISKNKMLVIAEGADHGEMLDGEKELAQYRAFLDSIAE